MIVRGELVKFCFKAKVFTFYKQGFIDCINYQTV